VVIWVLKHRALRHKCRAVSSDAFAAASLIGSKGSIDVFKDDGRILDTDAFGQLSSALVVPV